LGVSLPKGERTYDVIDGERLWVVIQCLSLFVSERQLRGVTLRVSINYQHLLFRFRREERRQIAKKRGFSDPTFIVENGDRFHFLFLKTGTSCDACLGPIGGILLQCQLSPPVSNRA
jgi:hypothetical protein